MAKELVELVAAEEGSEAHEANNEPRDLGCYDFREFYQLTATLSLLPKRLV
jgi:hypothetical protein